MGFRALPEHDTCDVLVDEEHALAVAATVPAQSTNRRQNRS
jgi:hypothetical protein